MPRFRTVAVLTAIVGFATGVALAAVDPGYDVALAADTSTGGGLLRSLAQTFARPFAKALNLAGGAPARPGANAADQKQQQQLQRQQQQQQQQQKNNPQGPGRAGN